MKMLVPRRDVISFGIGPHRPRTNDAPLFPVCSRERFPGLILLAASKWRAMNGAKITPRIARISLETWVVYTHRHFVYTFTPVANYESTFIRNGQTLFNFHHHGLNYYRLAILLVLSSLISLSLSFSFFATSLARWERNRARMVI